MLSFGLYRCADALGAYKAAKQILVSSPADLASVKRMLQMARTLPSTRRASSLSGLEGAVSASAAAVGASAASSAAVS